MILFDASSKNVKFPCILSAEFRIWRVRNLDKLNNTYTRSHLDFRGKVYPPLDSPSFFWHFYVLVSPKGVTSRKSVTLDDDVIKAKGLGRWHHQGQDNDDVIEVQGRGEAKTSSRLRRVWAKRWRHLCEGTTGWWRYLGQDDDDSVSVTKLILSSIILTTMHIK